VSLQKSLFEEEEKKTRKREPKTSKDPPAPPSLEDVKQYFLTQNADTRLENWERSALLFYDTFNADGWVNKRGRNVAETTRWQSEVSKWIFYREENEKKLSANETKKDNRDTRPDAPANDRRQGEFDIADYVSRKLSPREEQSGGFDIDDLV